MRKTWSILKEIVNKHKKSQVQSKFKLCDGSITNDKQLISNQFNEYFIGIGPSLAKKIPKQVNTPLSFMGNQLLNSIFLEHVTVDELDKIFNTLKKICSWM